MSVVFDGHLLADYHQIIIANAFDYDIPLDYTDEVMKARVLTGRGVLVVQTARNMTVPVRVELHKKNPEIDVSKVDHAVKGPIQTSGRMIVMGFMDYEPTAATFSVPAGNLCALVLSTGLGTLSWNGLEGNDRYIVHLWPGQCREISVLRQWPG